MEITPLGMWGVPCQILYSPLNPTSYVNTGNNDTFTLSANVYRVYHLCCIENNDSDEKFGDGRTDIDWQIVTLTDLQCQVGDKY